jgi:hypothetical protein
VRDRRLLRWNDLLTEARTWKVVRSTFSVRLGNVQRSMLQSRNVV